MPRDWLWYVLNARALWEHYQFCRRHLDRRAARYAAVQELRFLQMLDALPSQRRKRDQVPW